MDFKKQTLSISYCKTVFSLLFFTISLPINAEITELYNISIGSTITNFNSSFSIDSNNGRTIELENTLGFDKQINSSWISAWYRVGDVHRVRLTYIPISRFASIENDKDITIDNTVIKSGAAISSSSTSDIVDFSYIYSFHKTANLEAGVSVGIYWLLNSISVKAEGEIKAEGDNNFIFKSDYSTEQKLQAPMPLLGLSVNYEWTPSWRSHASLRYLNLDLNETRGKILSFELGSEYFFNNNWGMGASISSFDLDIDAIKNLTTSTLSWGYSGIQLYVVFKY